MVPNLASQVSPIKGSQKQLALPKNEFIQQLALSHRVCFLIAIADSGSSGTAIILSL